MAGTEPASLSSPATVAISPPETIVSSLRVGFSLRRLASDSSIMVAGSVLANALSFIFSFATAHLLDPANYATMAACLSLLVVTTVPGGAFQLVSARFAAQAGDDPAVVWGVRRSLTFAAVLLGSATGVIALLFAGPLSSFLHVSSLVPLWLTAGILAASFLGPVYRGLLQGLHAFAALAAVMAAEFFVRVVGALLFVHLGFGESGALLAVLLGVVGSAVLGYLSLRAYPKPLVFQHPPVGQLALTFTPTLLMQLCLSSLMFVDTLIAKHFFTATIAGLYAGIATAARITVYFPGALSSVLFPAVARLRGNAAGQRSVTNIIVGAAVAIELALLLVFQLDPQLVLRVVVGPHYLPASGDLPWLALALAAYSIASLLANHLLATSNRLFLLPLAIAPIVQIVLMVALSGSLLSFIHAFDAVTLGLLCCLLVIYFMPQRQHSQERH
ncbi:MAG: hypothetical protein M1118_10845 [Chloroflexi bacterium]|nr:hypothetical protein [Chloroflexota bacterium]